MTIGIYKLVFNNTDKVYIGQSNCIEKRWTSHISNMRFGKATSKLQKAYNDYGISHYEVLCECSIKELNALEIEAIEIYDSYNNGFNSTPSSTGPNLLGENNPSALETNDTYREVLRLLVQTNPTLNKREISDICNVSIYTVRHIAALESHIWLKEDMPEEYSKLVLLKNNKYYRGTQYPKLISPDGDIHEVSNITNFSKLNNLSQPKITEVMQGTRLHHKGWKRLEP